MMRLQWTVEEFDALGEHGFFSADDRVELIGGELVPMSPKGNRHEVVRGQFGQWLTRNLPVDFNVYIEPGWRAGPTHYIEPDILVFPNTMGLDQLLGPDVLLIIEIANSSLSYDAGRKAKIYAALGVRDYWVLNAITLETRIHRAPAGETYGHVSDHAQDETLTPELLPDLAVCLGALGIG